jgi:hypothetical protein
MRQTFFATAAFALLSVVSLYGQTQYCAAPHSTPGQKLNATEVKFAVYAPALNNACLGGQITALPGASYEVAIDNNDGTFSGFKFTIDFALTAVNGQLTAVYTYGSSVSPAGKSFNVLINGLSYGHSTVPLNMAAVPVGSNVVVKQRFVNFGPPVTVTEGGTNALPQVGWVRRKR